MKLKSLAFGEIEYEEQDVISFEEGLYGFESLKKFLFIPSGDEEFHFHWLQSVEDEELSFMITSPFLFVDNYDFEFPDTVAEKMGIESLEDVTVFSIAKIPESVEETTINLQAPLIINTKSKKGKQLILDEKFTYRFYIFKKELNERK